MLRCQGRCCRPMTAVRSFVARQHPTCTAAVSSPSCPRLPRARNRRTRALSVDLTLCGGRLLRCYPRRHPGHMVDRVEQGWRCDVGRPDLVFRLWSTFWRGPDPWSELPKCPNVLCLGTRLPRLSRWRQHLEPGWVVGQIPYGTDADAQLQAAGSSAWRFSRHEAGNIPEPN